MGQFELGAHPHRRLNPLTREWVLVSPHRTQRPWQGQIEPTPSETSVAYDPQCYLCPGNARAGGAKNPDYESTFLFDNDFAALRPDTPAGGFQEADLLKAQSEAGQCRVICYSPRHDLTLARMSVDELKVVVDTWCEEFARLAILEGVRSVQIFENRGAMMGCSNPHPHGQIWANETVPDGWLGSGYAGGLSPRARCYASGRLFGVGTEENERVVCANEHFAALVPFWAVWPYETLLISRRP